MHVIYINCDVFVVPEATGVQRMEWAETGLHGLVETERFEGGVEELHNILVE